MASSSRDRSLALVQEAAEACTRCPLSGTRSRVVFGEGSPHSRLMLVGEAPGAEEDASGRPFAGDAGTELDRLLAKAGLSRADAYVANTVKCRPPGNRRPGPAEVEACAPFLDLQLAVVRPDVVVALGETAARRLAGPITTLAAARGRDFGLDGGATATATYHPSPSALNRERGRRSLVVEDLRRAAAALAERRATG